LTSQPNTKPVEFSFHNSSVADLQDEWRRFTLSADDIALLNPNTGTMATFHNQRYAEITKAIYRRVPVLIQEEPPQNHWGISFLRMFHMAGDSHLFCTRDKLEAQGYVLQGNHFVRGDEHYLPLYEAKMMHQFTHRWATYETNGKIRNMTPEELRDPNAMSIPRYWVDARDVQARLDFWDHGWLLGFRSITRSTDERTAIFGVIPRVAIGGKLHLVFTAFKPQLVSTLIANANALIFDHITRQKVGGTNLDLYIVKQLPVIPPHTYTQALLDFIVPRVLELTYTAWDLQPFAQDLGYDEPPFVWDEGRRLQIRCELDALYFHLYQIKREDVDYIME
ncbi:MAG: type II DNA modification enzyme, partial [Phototrophicales bacterium]